MRLIDADALIDKSYWHGEMPTYDKLFPNGGDAVDVEDIDNAPTIDAIPVVRCKDCKWSHHDLDTEDNLVFMCEMWDEYPMANEDGYCHKGRRKEVIT